MSGQSVNANVDFGEFSRGISICICIRILGMFSSLFMVISSLSFILCYGLLQSSKYIDQFISQLNDKNDHTITAIKKMTNATIISIGNSMLGVLMPWNIDLTIIKEEVSTLYENMPANCESSSDDEDEDDTLMETGSSNNNSVDDNTSNDSGGDSDGDSDGDDSNNPASVSDVSTIQTHISTSDDNTSSDNIPNDGNNFRSITPNITEQEQKEQEEKEQEPETPDIEDITQQRMAEIKIEREKQKENNLMDISSESD